MTEWLGQADLCVSIVGSALGLPACLSLLPLLLRLPVYSLLRGNTVAFTAEFHSTLGLAHSSLCSQKHFIQQAKAFKKMWLHLMIHMTKSQRYMQYPVCLVSPDMYVKMINVPITTDDTLVQLP